MDEDETRRASTEEDAADANVLRRSSAVTSTSTTSTIDASTSPTTTSTTTSLPFPQPLSHSLFLQEPFETSSFLLTRKHVLLDDLRSDLRAYLATLRQELVAIINSDYEDFINLGGSHLLGSDDQMSFRMRKPLEGVSREIQDAQEELTAAKRALEDRLRKRDDIRSKKLACRRLLGVNDQLIKVEELLHIQTPKSATTNPSTPAGSHAQANGWSSSSNEIDSASPSKRLERIAQEYNHLLYLVRKCDGLAYVDTLQPRLERITSTLLRDLGALLASHISPESTPTSAQSQTKSAADRHRLRLDALTDCFRTYASIGKYREAEEVLRKQLVTPAVNKIIYREALLSPQSPMLPATPFPHTGSIDSVLAGAQKGSRHTSFPFDSVNGLSSITEAHIPTPYRIEPISVPASAAGVDTSLSDALVDLYNKLLTFISKDLGDILDITERKLSVNRDRPQKADTSRMQVFGALGITSSLPDASVVEDQPRQGFELLSSVVFAEIAHRLNTELSHLLFSAGRTDTFHRNYMATRLFVERIEGLCPTLRHLNSLRQSPEYVAFMRRWQLPVYFQLRFKEIVGSLEGTLRTATVIAAPTAVLSAAVIMSSTDASLKAVRTCWHDDVYIPELSGRSWRLTLQLIARHKTWLQTHLPDYSSAQGSSSQATTVDNATSGGSTSALNRLLPSAISSRPSTPNAQPPNATEEAADDELLRKASIIVADVSSFQAAITTFYDSSIRRRLPDLAEDTCRQSLQYGLDEIGSLAPDLQAAMISVLIKRCSEPLRLVRTGASQTRSTSSYGSSEVAPSYFIPSILRPAKAFVESSGRLLHRDVQLALMASIFEEIANRYEASLTKMKKDGDALRRLKKGRQGFQLFGSRSATPADKGPSAEDEQVKAQLHADVEAFAKDAVSMGIDVSQSEALAALRSAVQNWTT